MAAETLGSLRLRVGNLAIQVRGLLQSGLLLMVDSTAFLPGGLTTGVGVAQWAAMKHETHVETASAVKVTAEQWAAMPWDRMNDVEIVGVCLRLHGEVVTRERVRQARDEHGRGLALGSLWRGRRTAESIARLERLRNWVALYMDGLGAAAAVKALGCTTLPALALWCECPEAWLDWFLTDVEMAGDRRSLLGTRRAVRLARGPRKARSNAIPWDVVAPAGWDAMDNVAVAAKVREALPVGRRAAWDLKGRGLSLTARRRQRLYDAGVITRRWSREQVAG